MPTSQGPSSAFDHIADGYDSDFTRSAVGRLQRQRVHRYLSELLDKHAVLSVLELNCGTGEDALWLAKRQCRVLATDVSEGMVRATQKKARAEGYSELIDARALPAENLSSLPNDGSFDLIFSNFGGLNCLAPEQLPILAQQAQRLLRPGGHFVGVIMSSFCWWESLYFLAKGQWRQAWRRRQRQAIQAPLAEGVSIATWYYSPRRFCSFFRPPLQVKHYHTVGFFLPPSYLDPAFKKIPLVLKGLNRMEEWSPNISLFAAASDHFLVHLTKT
ncbi:MAG: class I SAM-dependent methyltransferase [Bacteroidota bacterium]